MRKRRLVMVACLAAASSYVRGQDFKISRGPEVKVSQDDDVDFTSFKTFAWVDTQEPTDNAANHVRITKAVERDFEARGLKPAGDAKPDLRVHYFAKIEKKLRGAARQGESTVPLRTSRPSTSAASPRAPSSSSFLVDGSRLWSGGRWPSSRWARPTKQKRRSIGW